jgi:uncharacterized LabA/DUF88 family protein
MAVPFIYWGYLAKIPKSFRMPKLDFLSLSIMLCKERDNNDYDGDRLITYCYYCMPFQGAPPSAEESSRYGWADKFVKPWQSFQNLRWGWEGFKKTQNGLSSDGAAYVQKGIDVMLGVDLVKMSWGRQIDRAMMLAADGNFIYAVQTAKDAGVSPDSAIPTGIM